MSLVDRFCHHLAMLQVGPGRALVAVSGGADSLALLDLLVRSRDRHDLALIVAHVDHGIHPDSGRVAEMVRGLAERYGLPFELGRLRLGAGAGETIARAERYAWFERTRQRLGAACIVTAHHADDQVETVLMRVLQGSGPAGLAGMVARRQGGTVLRPLLAFRRTELAAYAGEAGLTPWLDPANADPRHLRSWIRAELLPVIRVRLSDADRNLRRLAAQAARDRDAWDTVLDGWPGLDLRMEDDGVSCAVAGLGPAGAPLAQALLVAVARRAGCQIGPARLPRVVTLLEGGNRGASVPLGAGWRAELSFDRLYLRAASAAMEPREPWFVQGGEGERWWGRWRFRWRFDSAPQRQERQGLSAWFPAMPERSEPLLVREWQPGERIRPLAGVGRRPVRRCLQEARVPRWRRAEWPVVTAGTVVVWVPGICRSDALVPPAAAAALRLDAEYV